MINVILSGHLAIPHLGHLEMIRVAYTNEYPCNIHFIVNNDRQGIAKRGYNLLDEQTRLGLVKSFKWVNSASISQSTDESIAIDLENFNQHGLHTKFINSGDRNEVDWNPKEVEVCERKGIQMVYLRLPKVNSSSKILDDYYHWRHVQGIEKIIERYRGSTEKLEYDG